MGLAMPTNLGYCIFYYTGEIKTLPNGKQKRITKDLYFKSKEQYEQTLEELKQKGYEIELASECIF